MTGATPAMTTAYPELEARFRRLGTVEEAVAMLHWDAAAMMPSGGAASRTEQLATLRVIAHQLLTAPDIADLFAGAEAEDNSLGVCVASGPPGQCFRRRPAGAREGSRSDPRGRVRQGRSLRHQPLRGAARS